MFSILVWKEFHSIHVFWLFFKKSFPLLYLSDCKYPTIRRGFIFHRSGAGGGLNKGGCLEASFCQRIGREKRGPGQRWLGGLVGKNLAVIAVGKMAGMRQV